MHCINRIKTKNYMIISIEAEKSFDKIQAFFHDKKLLQIRHRKSVLDVIEAI